MGSLSDYAENKILDHLMGKAAYTMPTVYVALSTADPLDTGAGVAEPSGNGYARKATAGVDWNAAASGAIDNANAIAFAQATGSWGTVTHFALYDALTGGNMIGHGTLTTSKVVTSGDTVSFAAGALDATLD
ncbi:hypothetical protein MNBD_DELTA01-1617 [hydrothermal vent metagenome]|uniref:Uncharacterized protein n=1 Tax=hydrothermal vent metagenome TaxID=652676 RepID=A0A3B0QPN9_9ZZZZ